MKSTDGRFTYFDNEEQAVPVGAPAADVHRFGFQCRRNPKGLCTVNLRGRGHDREKKSWTWDGNVDQPTLAPSINCAGCWHGFIEGGVFLDTQKQPEKEQ